ncbi:hypothetical protein CXB51_034062 [Gossypium anomalum]|uniref:Uncharacterized protein n=1 Tax=Gossypium anomalum TaxID=47600 RepID=A0A8J5YAV3_9ROSI|nr:hypothetical protein CXB51_034062 [Gossypium anomalum]
MVGPNPSVSNNGVGRATNKVRLRTELPSDTNDPTVDGNGQKVQESEVPKASYKSTLLCASQALTQNTLLEEEFVLMDGDVTTVVVEGVPSITYSNRSILNYPAMVVGLFNGSERNQIGDWPNYWSGSEIGCPHGLCSQGTLRMTGGFHYGHGSKSCIGVQSALPEKEDGGREEVSSQEWLRTVVRTTLMVARDLLCLERLREMNKIM